MTCYFRHMKDIFGELGINITAENKRDVDRKIHEMLGIEYKDCSATWKEIKKHLSEDRVGFIAALREKLIPV